jgi:Rrf2 family transcriptional regulator, cysteine metabolism repressor
MIINLINLINIVRYDMRVSAKTRYAMEAMVDVVMQGGEGPVAVKEVARRRAISPHYLQQIFVQLRTAGLVRSERGARGGFVLGRPPSDIRMSEIVSLFEGPMDLIGCAVDTDSCSRSVSCAVRQLWVEVGEGIRKTLDSVTLQEVTDLQATKEAGVVPTRDNGKRRKDDNRR